MEYLIITLCTSMIIGLLVVNKKADDDLLDAQLKEIEERVERMSE